MRYPKVLLACPTNSVKDYCFEEWVENVSALTYPNFAVFMADNSETKDYAQKIRSKGITCEWIKPFGKSLMQRITDSHETCRQYAIRFEFDYLFHLESDVFPHRTIIEDLLTARKSVVGAVYHIGLGNLSEPMIQIVEETDDDNFVSTRNLREDLPDWMDGSIKKVYHCGLGCVLIHNRVLPHFKFRYEDGKPFHPDSYFAMDLYRKGIDIYCDTSLIAKHKNQIHSLEEFV